MFMIRSTKILLERAQFAVYVMDAKERERLVYHLRNKKWRGNQTIIEEMSKTKESVRKVIPH
jgi:hypothetical protein